jgi:regulator of extracellular matrix RemA (YlzA/DUF370 family)
MNNKDMELILGYWNEYKSEIIFSEIIKHKSYRRMYHKLESEVLYSLIRGQKPKNLLELGCFDGFTSLIMIRAVQTNKIPAKFISSDLRDQSQYMDYDDGTTSRRLIVGDSKQTIDSKIGELDFLLVDSDHTYDFAKWYCNVVFPFVKKGCFIMVHDWEGIEGDKDDEFRSIIENAINVGTVKRCMNLMEYTKKNPHLSLTPGRFKYAVGDRSPTEILIKL